MQKAGLLLRGWTRAWKSVRMASSGLTRQNPLANKVALVTASTDGIGLAIARRLAEDGAHVVISSRKQQNVDRAVATLQGEGLSVTGVVCHVGKAEDREKLVNMSLGPYNVSKTALLGLTKNFAAELAPKNIRVNCLAPGLIKTHFSSVLWKEKAREEMIKETMQIRRLGKPEDCVGIVSFLCSEDASYINGETVVVGGGTPSRL
ncbi:dehydrogenase/reductase (SDR family) member 4, isoform CRA_c [Rattus norvegicus]|uniref:Dehydrogenase/reductase (SDR family) member 4, isoform CRA_c n=1 Tax=Rattus norvegicus TaxID=10116 RepID=A6KGZ7_RAT|nr:dehydrogenase/reductase (SDR family) member 4, isoform CRA_c [Rattus norvegicus]